MNKFTEPIGGIWRDKEGRILEPKDPELLDRYLKAEEAWRRYYANGDRTQLVELGIFLEQNGEKHE